MLQPRRTKYRKQQKGRIKGNAGRGHRLTNGTFGIKSMDTKLITARQIEAARIGATRYMRRERSIWLRIYPDRPITKTPLEVRMGKGKGNVELWAAPVQPRRMLIDLGGVSQETAKEALRLAAQKLPVRTKFVVARDYKE